MMYPGYQRFFLACDEGLCRPQANTAHKKPMAPWVKTLQMVGRSNSQVSEQRQLLQSHYVVASRLLGGDFVGGR